MLLLTADVEKIAELATLKLGSKWFSSNRYDASDKLKMTPSPTLSKKSTVTGNLVLRYKALFEICPATGSLVPRLDILVVPRYESLVPKNESLVPKHESLMQMDFTAKSEKI